MIVLIWIGFILCIALAGYCLYRAVTTTIAVIQSDGVINFLRFDAGMGFWAFVIVLGPIVLLVLLVLLFGYLAYLLKPFLF